MTKNTSTNTSISDYLGEIRKEQEELQNLKKEITPQLSKAPKGKIWVTHSKQTPIYLYVEDTSTTSTRKYLSKSKSDLIQKLVQKEYDEKVLNYIEKKILLNQEFLTKSEKLSSLFQIYDSLTSVKQALVDPHFISDKQFLEDWLSYEFVGKGFSEDSGVITSNKGERVRSKSEKIIADALFANHLPYRYEAPVRLDGNKVFYPDFTILRMRDRRNILWEHFGMMDDMEYSAKALSKIETYQQNGYLLGDTLLITYETKNCVLGSAAIERIINQLK